MGYELYALIGVGFFLGMKHAFDADHLVAVSTILSQSKGLLKSSAVGLAWGLGHTATLLAVGSAVLFFSMPLGDNFGTFAEAAVGAMLLILGASVVLRHRRMKVHLHPHGHGDEHHLHFHSHAFSTGHSHEHSGLRSARAFIVGLVHGLAGSAALMLLVLTRVRSPIYGLLYIAAFGFGSILGMMSVSTALGLAISGAQIRFRRAGESLKLATGLLSIAFGLYLIIELALRGGLNSPF